MVTTAERAVIKNVVKNAVNVAKREGGTGTLKHLNKLVHMDRATVIEHLLAEVEESAKDDPRAALIETDLMPNVERSRTLLHAVLNHDTQGLLDWSQNDAGQLVQGLVGLSAALKKA